MTETPPAPDKEPPLDIHKPKAWHGFRGFAKEYLIIVAGVLTALGGEQLVVRVHEAQVSNEAREAVRSELNLNLTNFKRRAVIQTCIDQKLTAIGRRLDAADRGAPFEPIGYVGSPPSPATATQRWDAATAGGRTSLLRSDEQADFARVYIEFMRVDRRQFDEEQAWAHLAALEGVAHPTAETLTRAREALGEARHMDFLIRGSLGQANTYAGRLGIVGDYKLAVTNRGVVQSICVPIDTPRDKAAAITQHPAGAP